MITMELEIESVFMIFMLVIMFFFMFLFMMILLQSLQKGSVIIERDEQGRITAIHYVPSS